MRVIWGEGLTDESNLGGSNQTFTNNVEKNRSGCKGSIRKNGIFMLRPTIRVDPRAAKKSDFEAEKNPLLQQQNFRRL